MPEEQQVQLEYERVFLARFIPEGVEQAFSEKLFDAYFPEDLTKHAKLRVRQKGKCYELTKKSVVSEGDKSVRTEQTIFLDEVEFSSLTQNATRIIAKTRYKLDIEGQPAEVDIFEEKLTGLVLIDFEFESAEEMAAFQAPECCLAEVTQEGLAGGILAGQSYIGLKEKLERFGYSPLFV